MIELHWAIFVIFLVLVPLVGLFVVLCFVARGLSPDDYSG